MNSLSHQIQKQNKQVDTEQSAFTRMQKARSELLLSHPFFGSLALKLKLKADLTSQNFWTDGKTLGYNPHFINMLPHEHIIACQAHEILHIACSHHLRRNGRDEKLWNKACDYAINGLLVDAGFKLPEAYYKHDPNYDGKSVDEIYVILGKMAEHDIHGGAKNARIAEKTDKKQDDASSGSGQNNSNEQGEEQKSKEAKAKSNEEQDYDQQDKFNVEAQGNSDTQKNKNSDDFFGEVKDHPLLAVESQENKQRAEDEALIQLTQAIQSSQGDGSVPKGLLRLYHKIINPKLDWQSLLQRFIETCNDGDYTWTMPNRRYISQEIYLPSRKEPRIPIMALAIDASGSIDKDTLAIFCTELENILESYDTTLFIMYHDTAVQKHDLYTKEDRPLRLFVQGGGGTSYKKIPHYLEQEGINPACLLWFTDFECTDFPDEPDYPVLWIASKTIKSPPPFGQYISI